MMLKKVYSLVILCLSFAVTAVCADLWGYTIDNYNVDMTLQTNGSLDVVEKIDVDFSEQRHGIYREIPLNYIAVSNVRVDNAPIANKSQTNTMLTLQIWDANATIVGPKTYIIRYTVDNAISIYSGWTELYRNVIGTQWDTTIAKNSRSLTLPKVNTSDGSGVSAVWWWYGEKLTWGLVFQKRNETQRVGNLSSILKPNQWITIGMDFPSDYFSFPAGYDTSQEDSYLISLFQLFRTDSIYFGFIILFVVISLSISRRNSSRGSNRPVTIYYTPPKDIEPSLAFALRNKDPTTPKVFTSLLYHRTSKWWAIIKKGRNNGLFWFFKWDQYHIVETSNDPKGASQIDRLLLQSFFWMFDTKDDDISLDGTSYTTITTLLGLLSKQLDHSGYTTERAWPLWSFGFKELTESGREMFEQMRWYKEFLSKVERPVIEQELKSDPDFISKILPWAVLFGVETRLLKEIEDLLAQLKRYQSDDWSYLTYGTFTAMNSSLRWYSMRPRSSHGGGWFSGGGRWWWGWGSW